MFIPQRAARTGWLVLWVDRRSPRCQCWTHSAWSFLPTYPSELHGSTVLSPTLLCCCLPLTNLLFPMLVSKSSARIILCDYLSQRKTYAGSEVIFTNTSPGASLATRSNRSHCLRQAPPRHSLLELPERMALKLLSITMCLNSCPSSRAEVFAPAFIFNATTPKAVR